MQIGRKQFKALFAQRRREVKKQESSKLKDLLTISLSIAAFCLSVFNFYTTGLRITDDLRVVVGPPPFAFLDFDGKRFHLNPEADRYIFINAGMRSAIISGVHLVFVQPQEGKALPETGCQMTQSYEENFSFEPLIIKPGEMISADVKFPLDAATNIPKPINVPFSSVNEKSEKVRYRVCIDVSFTTPSVEYGIETVSEFEDELDKNVEGYATTRGDERKEYRPVQLTKRNRVLFLD